MLKSLCDANEIRVIDTTDSLRDGLHQGTVIVNPFYYPHLNAAGMRIVARAIAEALADR